jgi:putative restriction endonuclease
VTESLRELELRRLIMNALTEATSEAGTVTRKQLSAVDLGFETRRVIDQSRGIWNPRDLEATLSVLSTPSGPYDDAALDGSVFRYDYRAGSIDGDNRKLRRAHDLGLPIILLRKVGADAFYPLFPVYVIADNVKQRHFLLGLDESLRTLADPSNPTPTERRYISRLTRQRLHQPEFRAKVLLAYETRCAVCQLKHGRLLDAAHIIGDREEGGDPIVTNGLTLCKIHHASYDANMLGISPDYTVHINRDLLEEVDGPMLKHGIQEMDQRALTIPLKRAERPDRERLALRYETFLAS